MPSGPRQCGPAAPRAHRSPSLADAVPRGRHDAPELHVAQGDVDGGHGATGRRSAGSELSPGSHPENSAGAS